MKQLDAAIIYTATIAGFAALTVNNHSTAAIVVLGTGVICFLGIFGANARKLPKHENDSHKNN